MVIQLQRRYKKEKQQVYIIFSLKIDSISLTVCYRWYYWQSIQNSIRYRYPNSDIVSLKCPVKKCFTHLEQLRKVSTQTYLLFFVGVWFNLFVHFWFYQLTNVWIFKSVGFEHHLRDISVQIRILCRNRVVVCLFFFLQTTNFLKNFLNVFHFKLRFNIGC